jgi:ABC-type branched-subunit amino acid transport system substrate-binding protein
VSSKHVGASRWSKAFAALTTVAAASAVAVVAGSGGAGAATSSDPIVVGGTTSLADAPGIVQGFEAGILRFNRAGGLDGRKISFVGVRDDGFSPETDLTDVQQLVQNDHVMVVAPFWSEVSPAAAGTFLASNKVPFIGWSSNSAYVAAPTWGYGFTGSDDNPDVQRSVSMKQLLAAAGDTKSPSKMKIAFIANDVAVADTSNAALAGDAKFAGMDVVYQKGAIPVSGTTSYAAYAQALIGSGANVVYEVLGTPDSVGLAGALKAAGYKGMIVNGVTYMPGELASQPNEAAALDGVYVESEFLTNQDKTLAVTQEEKDLTSIGTQPDLLKGTSLGYWSAIMLEQILKATLAEVGGDPTKVTGTAIHQMVNKGYVYKDPIAGGIGTVTFPVDEDAPSGCGTLVKTVGTNFEPVAPYQCTNNVNVKEQKAVSPTTGKSLGS